MVLHKSNPKYSRWIGKNQFSEMLGEIADIQLISDFLKKWMAHKFFSIFFAFTQSLTKVVQ